jgi:hypothetical protein
MKEGGKQSSEDGGEDFPERRDLQRTTQCDIQTHSACQHTPDIHDCKPFP